MKNKRGDVTQGKIIALVIGVFVLVLVSIFAYSFFTGTNVFFKFIPTFNLSSSATGGLEIFRYDVPNNKLQYYDGASWNDFKLGTSLKINNKKISSDSLRSGIREFYETKSELPKERIWESFTKKYKKYRSDDSGSYNAELTYDEANITRFYYSDKTGYGAVEVDITNVTQYQHVFTSSEGFFEESNTYSKKPSNMGFLISFDDSIYSLDRRGYSSPTIQLIEKPNEDEIEIKNKAIEWRDSILKNPVELCWDWVEKSDEPKCNSFCLDKISDSGKVYLWVDLSKPVSKSENCGGSA